MKYEKAILLGILLVIGIAKPLAAKDITQWDGVYTAAQAKRGEILYTQHCQECHGANLEGFDKAPALVGTEFANNWNRLRLGLLLDRTIKLMPKAKPGSLDHQVYADVLAFILSKGGYPAGDAELPSNPRDLISVKFLAKNPTQQ